MSVRDHTSMNGQRHREAIHRLAQESGAPEAEVGRMYEEELGKMPRDARVGDYLPLLVTRQVKQRLRAQR